MNKNQLEKYKQYEDKIKREIADMENYALALSLIEYNPKADGTERNNFDDNFSIRGLGPKAQYASGKYYRRVKVKPVTYSGWWEGKCQERVLCLDITVTGITNENDMKAAGVEQPVKTVDDYRFAFSGYTKRHEMPTDTKPEEYVKIIRNEIVPGIKERIKKLWGELGRLPDIFQTIIKAANACHEAETECEGTDRLKYLVSDMIKDIPKLHD